MEPQWSLQVSRPKLLLVVHDMSDAIIYESLLAGEFRVKIARTWGQAVKACRREPFAVIAIVLRLPHGSAEELLRRLRARGPNMHTPALAIAAAQGQGEPHPHLPIGFQHAFANRASSLDAIVNHAVELAGRDCRPELPTRPCEPPEYDSPTSDAVMPSEYAFDNFAFRALAPALLQRVADGT